MKRTLAALALISLGCTSPRTQIVARIDTDMTQGPTEVLTGVLVRVTAMDETTPRYEQRFELAVGSEPLLLPSDLGLVPSDPNANRRVTVEVEALHGDERMFTRRAIVTFAPQHTLRADIFLADRCRLIDNQNCPIGSTCGLTGCELEEVPLSELDAGLLVDAGPAPQDAGRLDAGPEVGVDSGASDAGASDAGTSDAGASDAGTSDAGTSDAGTSAAGASDAGTSDAGTGALTEAEILGTWERAPGAADFGQLYLVRWGPHIRGVYEFRDGRVVVDFEPTTGVLSGYWSQTPTRRMTSAGLCDFVFSLGSGGRLHAEGRWNTETSAFYYTDWDLDYVGPTVPPAILPLFMNDADFVDRR